MIIIFTRVNLSFSGKMQEVWGEVFSPFPISSFQCALSRNFLIVYLDDDRVILVLYFDRNDGC